MRGLPVAARAYVIAVMCAAAIMIAAIVTVDVDWLTLAVLTGCFIVAERWGSALIRIHGSVTVSAGASIALAGILLLPPSAAAAVCATGAFVKRYETRSWVKRVFNGSMYACAGFVAGYVYEVLGGQRTFDSDALSYLPQALLAEVVYCAINGLLLAGVIRLTEGTPLLSVWRSALSSTILPYLGYGLVGVVIAVLWQSDGGPASALLVVLPLYIARWTFALYGQEQDAYNAAVGSLIQAVETKDHYTRGHSERVGAGSTMIAKQLRMADDRRQALYFAGLLHDLGKLGIPTRVLNKNGPLTDDEYDAMKLHPVHGLEMVRGIGFLREAYAGILHHHERIDGRGYPLGLKGDEIPEFARIIAVADAFDCMTSTRSYRGARTVDDSMAELVRCAGTQFDPRMVSALADAVAQDGWEPQVVPPPSADEAATVASFDHDDPTILIPVIPDDDVPESRLPDVQEGSR